MAIATKPPKRNSWANAAAGSPDIEESGLVDTGWTPAGVIPTRGEMNFELNRYDNGLNYLLQRGIADWSADETDYAVGAIVRYTNNQYYQLFGTATTGVNPATDVSNWIRILKMPRAVSGGYTQPIWDWENAQSLKVFGINRLGFPSGRLIEIRENWLATLPNGDSFVSANGNGPFLPGWRYRLVNAGGGAVEYITANGPWVAHPNTTRPRGPMLGLNASGVPTGGSLALVEKRVPLMLMDQSSIDMEVEFTLNGTTAPQATSSFAFGLGDGSLFAGANILPIETGAGPLVRGAFLEFGPDSSTNWAAVTRIPGAAFGTRSVSNTLVAAVRDTRHLYQIQVAGTADGDGGVARVIHKLDGAVVGDHAVSMVGWTPTPFFRVTADGGPETCYLNVGALRINGRLTDLHGVIA